MYRRILIAASALLLGSCAPERPAEEPSQPAGAPPNAAGAAGRAAAADRQLSIPDPIRASCAELANVVDRAARNAGLESRAAIVGDTLYPLWFEPGDPPPAPGCVVRLADSTATRSIDPAVAAALEAAGWTNRSDRISADGHDGTLFGYSREGSLCIVAARWDGGVDDDTSYAPQPGFTLEVVCLPDRPAADPTPPAR